MEGHLLKLSSQAKRVARLLRAQQLKAVFAESCTGGLVSATLAQIPGISEHHCGGMVVYRNDTKHVYLGITDRVLRSPGPVSEKVARLMAERVLEATPEADVSAAVTGHLGPNAPREMDGLVYIAVVHRPPRGRKRNRVFILEYRCPSETHRVARQRLAAAQVLQFLAATLT